MKNQKTTDNNTSTILSAFMMAVSCLMLKWLYSGHQAHHFWPIVFMLLIAAVFSISIDTFFQAQKFKTSALTKN